MWDDAHSMKVRPFVCYTEDVTFQEELNNGCDGNPLGKGRLPWLHTEDYHKFQKLHPIILVVPTEAPKVLFGIGMQSYRSLY